MKVIRNLKNLMDYFGAENANLINRRLYKATSCGASISVLATDDKWYHCGSDWTNVKGIKAFTIQTIVEGSDVTVDSEEFTLPVRTQEIEDWMNQMEEEAAFYWKRDNTKYYAVVKADRTPVVYYQWTDWEDKPEVSNPRKRKLVMKAHAAYEADGNALDAGNGARRISYTELIPIPGTKFFVKEEETPDITF